MDSHDELLKAFQAYYKANQRWLTRRSRQAGLDTRKWLSEIRRICSKRRVEIQEWRHQVDAEKQERKRIQKEKASTAKNTT